MVGVLDWVKRLWSPPMREESEDSEELKRAVRLYEVSSRRLRFRAARSARAFRALSEALAERARVLEGVSAADDALRSLDQARRDD